MLNGFRNELAFESLLGSSTFANEQIDCMNGCNLDDNGLIVEFDKHSF